MLDVKNVRNVAVNDLINVDEIKKKCYACRAMFDEHLNWRDGISYIGDIGSIMLSDESTIKDKVFAVVGSRKVTIDDYARWSDIIDYIDEVDDYFFLSQDITPIMVSGFAVGVDRIALEHAVDKHMRTITVLPFPLFVKGQINREIASQPGAVDLLERAMKYDGVIMWNAKQDRNPTYRRKDFINRNLLIASLSSEMLAVGLKRHGGTAHTVAMMTCLRRPVFLPIDVEAWREIAPENRKTLLKQESIQSLFRKYEIKDPHDDGRAVFFDGYVGDTLYGSQASELIQRNESKLCLLFRAAHS